MFRNAVFRQCRAISTSPSIRLSPNSISRQSSLLQQSARLARPLPPRLQQFRLASTEANGDKTNQDGKPATEVKNGTEKPAEEEDPLKKELAAKDKEIVDLKDKYLRSVADFRNLQERTRRDVESARTFAIQRFAVDLIESIDNFERALGAVPAEKVEGAGKNAEENKDLVDLFSGLKMMEGMLMNTLKKHGLVRFDPSEKVDGQTPKFDPSKHEAVFMAPVEGKEDGEVMHVQTKGFTLNGRVLRAAKVGVVKNA